jgi:hypothetical protein
LLFRLDGRGPRDDWIGAIAEADIAHRHDSGVDIGAAMALEDRLGWL